MARVLHGREFKIVECVGDDATRAGILDAYGRLITAAEPGDATFVYYSGHGGIVHAPDGDNRGPVQFVVPADVDDSTAADFRGVTSVELSVLLAELTRLTRNVTAMFDCCHSGQISRTDLTTKSLPRPMFTTVTDHVRRLAEHGLRVGVRDLLGNENAVRIVACGQHESAYEGVDGTGRHGGLLTTSFEQALVEAGDLRVTWYDLMARTRRLVRARALFQRPDVEGP